MIILRASSISISNSSEFALNKVVLRSLLLARSLSLLMLAMCYSEFFDLFFQRFHLLLSLNLWLCFLGIVYVRLLNIDNIAYHKILI